MIFRNTVPVILCQFQQNITKPPPSLRKYRLPTYLKSENLFFSQMSKTSLKQYQINKGKQIELIRFTDRYWWQQTNLCPHQGMAGKPTYKYNLHKVKQCISNDIEVNPGPILESTNKKHLHVCTYNVQGMKDFKKLKRFFNFLHKQKFI